MGLNEKETEKTFLLVFCAGVGAVCHRLCFFHFFTPGVGLTPVFHKEAGKPMVALLFRVFGVLFLFAGCMSGLVGRIVFSNET